MRDGPIEPAAPHLDISHNRGRLRPLPGTTFFVNRLGAGLREGILALMQVSQRNL